MRDPSGFLEVFYVWICVVVTQVCVHVCLCKNLYCLLYFKKKEKNLVRS